MPFQRFPLLLALLIFLDINDLDSANPQVTLTTNVTSILVGQPFTARCQVADYEVKGNEDLVFEFLRKNSTTERWLIDYHYEVDGSGQRHWRINGNNTKHADLAIDLNPSTIFPICEVNMRPMRPADYEYSCEFLSGTLPRYYSSNHVSVSIRKPIRTTFTSNVSQVVAGQSFTGTCHLEGMANAANRNYSVQFWSSEGLLGAYLVYAPKQSTAKPFVLFKETKQDNTTVSNGAHAAYPTFDILISTTDASQIFWCTLLDERQPEYRSNIFPTPVVTFTANVSAHHDGVPFAGRCSITNFPPVNTIYSVGFFAGQAGLLATYVVQPNKPLDLVIKVHHPNVLISQGASLQLPLYELSINLTGPSQPFWCALQIDQHGEVREFKSKEVKL